MVFVAVNSLSVHDGQGEVLEKRFAARAGLVENSPGFLSFELWRPTQGTDDYLVVTRWEDEDSYNSWLASRQFSEGHAGQQPDGSTRQSPAAVGSQIWLFTAVISADGPQS